MADLMKAARLSGLATMEMNLVGCITKDAASLLLLQCQRKVY